MLIGFADINNTNVCLICLDSLDKKKCNIQDVQYPEWKKYLKCSCKHISFYHNVCLWEWYLHTKNYPIINNIFFHYQVVGMDKLTVYEKFSCPICRQECYVYNKS